MTQVTSQIICGDCLAVLRTIADESVDSIVTDPPYGLKFMGKKWDYDVPSTEVWAECLRVLKPGGHLLAFAGTRTHHRMVCRIEDAGFEIRDMIAWVYGSGFPKSLDVSKAVDKVAGAEREVVGKKAVTCGTGEAFGKAVGTGHKGTMVDITAPATEAAKQWKGFGTSLKPAIEPVGIYYKGLTMEATIGILLASLTEELWRSICRWSNVSASDAENLLNGIRARLEKAGAFSVVENVRTCALENIESAILAARSSTLPERTETARDTIKGGSVLEPANQNGRDGDTSEKATQAGRVDVMNMVDTFTSVIMERTEQNTALLWKNILEESLNQASTFTTATALRLTTGLKTLKLLMQASTSQGIGSSKSYSPAIEPITLARKPLIGTVAENVLKHGTGALNIDGCRVDYNGEVPNLGGRAKHTRGDGYGFKAQGEFVKANTQGRWPANFAHDGSEEVVGLFPVTTSGAIKAGQSAGRDMCAGDEDHNRVGGRPVQPKDVAGSTGSASRFFYCAKASKKERGEGNNHPTVKPLSLMKYLCRLVTPPNGIVLDPFMGSGSTGIAANSEGFGFIGIEKDDDYVEIAGKRIGSQACMDY